MQIIYIALNLCGSDLNGLSGLFQVDDPSKVEKAISSQLFKLTLGRPSNINVSQKNPDQASMDQISGRIVSNGDIYYISQTDPMVSLLTGKS